MQDIRKISIGPDYKNNAMHYIVGQPILDKTYFIHAIQKTNENSFYIWIEKEKEIVLWKEITNNVPTVVEFNINF